MAGRYRLRTCSMMLGSLIGVAALTLIVSIGTGAERKVLQTQRNFFNPSTILVTNGGGMLRSGPRAEGSRLSIDDIQELARALPSIETWDPVAVLGEAQVRRGDTSATVRLLGGSERGERIWDRGVTRGEYFDATAVSRGARVALIGETAVRTLFVDQDPLGAEIMIGPVQFRVLGILEPLGTDAHGMDRDNEILAPISTVMHRVMNVDTIWGARVLTRAPSEVQQTAAEVKRLLRERHALLPGTQDDFQLFTPNEMEALLARGRRVFFVFLPLAAGIAMLAGAVVSAALMLLSVNQRTAEIGLRRAVGARPRDIALQFVCETTVTTLLGGILGVLLGSGVSLLVARRVAIEGALSWKAALLGVVLSSALGLVAGVLPARRAAQLEPTDALR
jgi:putative ABC transport system permease protein